MTKIIDKDMTISKVEHELRTRGVASVDVRFDNRGLGLCLVQAHLHALQGPEGHVSTTTLAGASLTEALDKVCWELDEAAENEICVYSGYAYNNSQKLLGRYPNNDEGRQLAEQHVARADSGSYTTVFPK